jgi:hypothetical protein
MDEADEEVEEADDDDDEEDDEETSISELPILSKFSFDCFIWFSKLVIFAPFVVAVFEEDDDDDDVDDVDDDDCMVKSVLVESCCKLLLWWSSLDDMSLFIRFEGDLGLPFCEFIVYLLTSGLIIHHELFPELSFWTRMKRLWSERLWRIEFWK